MTVKPVRRLFPLALPLVLALVAAACAHRTSPPATVAGTDITDAQLASAAGVFKTLYGFQQRQPCGQKAGPTDTDEAACNRLALGALIEYHLVEDYATVNGISVSDAAIASSLRQIEQSVGKGTLVSQLQANGVGEDDLSALVRLSDIEAQVAKAVTAGQLGEAALRQRYQDDIAQFTTVQVEHILVKTQAEAEQIYQQTTQPGFTRHDFMALAKQHSIDTTSGKKGGSLGSATASSYVKPLADAVLALEPGQVSTPVHTKFGWHVIRMEDKKVTPYEQARDQIVQQAEATIFSDWLRKQIDAGKVEVNPSFGRYDRDTLQVLRITSTDPSATSSATVTVQAPASP